jgi:predicted RNase H-like HicB family nuclease
MLNTVYPVVFTSGETSAYCVYVPDIPGCVTSAESYAEGLEKIRDGIAGMLYMMGKNEEAFPPPRKPENIERETGDLITLVDVNLEVYKRKLSSRIIRHTIRIPEWLDELAVKNGLSLSQITQEALRQCLGVSE